MPQTPSLADLVVAVHFESDMPLTVLHLASWTQEFGAEFPQVEQLQALGRIDLAMNPYQLIPAPELPLMHLRSADGHFYLKLQADRFAFGWSRVREPGLKVEYPGFVDIMERWNALSSQFVSWLRKSSLPQGLVRLVELGYVNVRPIGPGTKSVTLADSLAFMKTVGRKYTNFQVQWTELLEPSPLAARVNASAGMGLVNGTQPALLFNFTGLGPASGSMTGSETTGSIDALHAHIIDMYEKTIISDTM